MPQAGLKTTVPATPDLLAANFGQIADDSVGVDRSANRINGYIVAETGDFKDKRGSFDGESLSAIVALGNAEERGVRSRFGHPNQSDDKLGKHLGRSKNFRLDTDGQRVRADLHLADSAMKEPVGGGRPLGEYVMDRVSEDAGALSSSLVVESAKTKRRGPNGEELTDHWLPAKLHASDIVGDGDAVHGDLLGVDLLSADGLDTFLEGSGRRLPSRVAVVASDYLNQLFPDADREVVETRFNLFRDRYLSHRFGADEPVTSEPEVDQEIQTAIDALSKKTDDQLSQLSETVGGLVKIVTEDRAERNEQLSAKQRAAEISSLCELAGVTDKGEISKFIGDDKLSVGDVSTMMVKRMAAKSQPPGDDAAGEAGDSLSDQQKAIKAEAKLKAEYDELGFKSGELSFEDYKEFVASKAA